MAFGNPYGDKWDAEIVMEWAYQLYKMGIRKIALADTIGVSTPKNISQLFHNLFHSLKPWKLALTYILGKKIHKKKLKRHIKQVV